MLVRLTESRGPSYRARLGLAVLWILLASALSVPRSLHAQQTAPRSGGRVYPMEAVDQLPQRVSCPAAYFPDELTAKYDEARVELAFIVGIDGAVEPASVLVLSSTDPGFDEPTAEMVAQCTFDPGKKGREPVRVQLRRPMQFTFRERSVEPLLDSLEAGRIYNVHDSTGGHPVLTQWPETIACPRYDPQERPARARASDLVERQRETERMPERVDALLEIVIGVDGIPEPMQSKVIRSSDFRFNDTLFQWVQSCRFRPGKIGDRAVRVRIEFPVEFSFVRE